MNLRLRELREACGLSPKQMYTRLGVKDSRYRKWESGASEMPIPYAMRCCEILRCTMDELTGRAGKFLTADERELLTLFRSTDERGRATILQAARSQQGVEGTSEAAVIEG